MSGKYRLLLAFWGALFLVSALMLFINVRSLGDQPGAILPPFPGDNTGGETGLPGDRPSEGQEPGDGQSSWSLVLSTVSALISAAGFMATTYFALRNDRRQTRKTELEIEKLANEIQRQRLEIEALRRAQQPPPDA